MRAHCAPRIRKKLAITPNKYTGLAKAWKPKSDDILVLVANFHSQKAMMKVKSDSHSMPSMRCVFINVKSPNVES